MVTKFSPQPQPHEHSDSKETAATTFVDSYYPALNSLNTRTQLASYYAPNAAIVWNGNAITGGEDFANVFASMPTSTYDPQSFDAQPIGGHGDPNASTGIFLSVSGSVRYGEGKDLQTFNETFVLQPEGPNSKKWKITVQNFRLVSD